MSRFLRRDIYAVTGPVEIPSVTEPGEGPGPPRPPRGRSGSATGHDKILMSPLIAECFPCSSREHVIQGLQIRQIWRILRQEFINDSKKFHWGVTLTPERNSEMFSRILFSEKFPYNPIH